MQFSASKNINLNGTISKYQKVTTILVITYNQFFPPLHSHCLVSKVFLNEDTRKLTSQLPFFLTYLRKSGHHKFTGTLKRVKTGIKFDIIKINTSKAVRSHLRTSNSAYTKRHHRPILATDLEGKGCI